MSGARAALAVAVAAIAPLLAACGSGGQKASTSARRGEGSAQAVTPASVGSGHGGVHAHRRSGSTTKAIATTVSFTSAADRVCRDYRQRVHSIAAQATTLSAQEVELGTLVTTARHAIAELRALSVPRADAAALAQYTELTADAVSGLAAAQRPVGSRQESENTAIETQNIQTYEHAAGDAEHARTVAQHGLHLHVCGSAGADWL
ncbi:MAG TPA: hypothetical protein VHX88_06690 [Solirubrobacteraceae bacterium]|jgi:hypothetical protein|nr:hypothetical protein [Solirubrobacteraceae bacterium]